jgi:EAL domain-containing protein (putative c-di-GMP-specific phosphodiesterase class I)/CheY-like chemotaxis protein
MPVADVSPSGAAPYRVLIVEDDRSQALFAERILTGAGLSAQVVSEAGEVIAALQSFAPDLVLMDLHMPELSGLQLTGMIRADARFLHTPIVFLTGDPDPERQFDVLESGADDYLTKPVRPRHLIAAVMSRVQRARLLAAQRQGERTAHPSTGLHTRPHVQRCIGEAVVARRGVLFLVELDGAAALRERLGYAAFEDLLLNAGHALRAVSGEHPAARLNDGAFVVLWPELDGGEADDAARALRDAIGTAEYSATGVPLKLRAAVGHAAIAHGFDDAGRALDAAEQAARRARLAPTGLAAWEPPSAAVREREQALAVRLREAIEQGRLELQFQPIVAVAGGEEAQFQVLLRMRDADGRLLSAGEIVPMAEAAGLMHEIDRWVLARALDLLAGRREEGRGLRLFVSQSPQTLSRDGHADWLRSAMEQRELPGNALVVDVRLADALVHAVALEQFCSALVPVGVQVCLSQFEHDAEADALMNRLALGYVRLSGRYASAQLDNSGRDQMRMAIDRAHRRGLMVIGQQIEDAQAAAALWMSGIDFIQGNLVQQAGDGLDFDFDSAVL